MNATGTAKTEEVIEEIPFLVGNDKWGGKVQILRVTVPGPDGTPRVFINKRLIYTGSNRYINLPRNGIEEMIQAITTATESERAHHEALLADINSKRSFSRGQEKSMFNNPRRGSDRRRGRNDEGDWR